MQQHQFLRAIADIETVYGKNGAGSGIVGLGNETVSVTDADVDAAKLTTIDGKTTGVVGFASTALENGTKAEVEAVLAEAEKTSPGINASLTKKLDVSTALSISEANAIAARTTGVLGQLLATGIVKLDKLVAETGGIVSGHGWLLELIAMLLLAVKKLVLLISLNYLVEQLAHYTSYNSR